MMDLDTQLTPENRRVLMLKLNRRLTRQVNVHEQTTKTKRNLDNEETFIFLEVSETIFLFSY